MRSVAQGLPKFCCGGLEVNVPLLEVDLTPKKASFCCVWDMSGGSVHVLRGGCAIYCFQACECLRVVFSWQLQHLCWCIFTISWQAQHFWTWRRQNTVSKAVAGAAFCVAWRIPGASQKSYSLSFEKKNNVQYKKTRKIPSIFSYSQLLSARLS